MSYTAFQLAEKLASERERVEQAIVAYCPVPVFVTDKDGRWISANEPMQRLMSQTEGQLSGDRWLRRVHPRSEEQQITYEQVFSEQAANAKMHLRFRAADKREFSAYVSLLRLSTANYLGFIVPICDTPVNCPVHGFLLHNLDHTGV